MADKACHVVGCTTQVGLTQVLGGQILMNVIFILVRLIGCLLGLFLVVAGVADVLGYVPHSEATPAWTARLLSALPGVFTGIVLLVPIRHFIFGKKYALLVICYSMVLVPLIVLGIQEIYGYLSGTRNFYFNPVVWLFFAVPSANLLALWYRHQHLVRPPNNSFKPNPLRGSA